MMKKNNIYVLLTALIVALLVPAVAYAQNVRPEERWHSYSRHTHGVDFPIGSASIDSAYFDNEQSLARIDSLLNVVAADTLSGVVAIEFFGTASPEGVVHINKELSYDRMVALEALVRSRIDISDEVVVCSDKYVEWSRLAEFIETDTTLEERDAVLELLRSYIRRGANVNHAISDRCSAELQSMQDGVVWDKLFDRYFEHMRRAWFIMVLGHVDSDKCEPITASEPVVEPTSEPALEPIEEPIEEPIVVPTEEPVAEPALSASVEESVEEPISEPAPVTQSAVRTNVAPGVLSLIDNMWAREAEMEQKRVRPAVMSIKTNILEDIALVANLGFEFRITPRISLDILGHYSPYDHFVPNRKVRVLAAQPELRYWWGESLVRGHFIGIHAPVAGFNVQLDDNYRYQDPNRALWGVGVSYGYAIPLGKKQKWGVEFTIGVGYMNVVYDVYEGVHNGKYLRTEKMNYFGPTRLGINFSYRIDKKRK